MKIKDYISLSFCSFVLFAPSSSFGEDFPMELFMPPILAGVNNNNASVCDGIVGCYEGTFTDNCAGSTISGKINLMVNDKCSFSSLSSLSVGTSGTIYDKKDSTYSGTGSTDPNGCGNFSITCRKNNSTLSCNYRYANGKSGSITNAVPVPCKPINRLKTELLAGSWVFTYQIISVFSDYYYLDINDVNVSVTDNKEYFINGTNKYGGFVTAQYSRSLNQYTLYDPYVTFDTFFVFNFTGNGTVSGCYYQIDNYDQSWSRCYPMVGTSLGKSASGKTRSELDVRSDTDAQKKKVDEVKVLETDNGKSIPKEIDSRILEEYKRVKSLIKNK